MVFPKYSGEMCDSLFKETSSLEVAINSLPVILTKFLAREEKAKESK